MKKLLWILSGLFITGSTVFLPSCSQEEAVAVASGQGNFNVTVSLPGNYSTRSLGDGLTATALTVALYDADDNDELITTQTETFGATSLSTTVSFNLINGKNYKMAFFAASSAATPTTSPVYEFDASTATLTVNYAGMTSDNNMADAYDCFYNNLEVGPVDGTQQNISVTLNRPVAQINLGSNDLDDKTVADDETYGANAAYLRTTLTSEVYSQLNLLTGAVTAEENINLTNFAAPTADFPVADYDYVTVFYLLAPSTASTVYDLKFTLNNSANTEVNPISHDIEVTSAPVQANYQTNIYGTLLTSKTSVNVTKSAAWTLPAFDEPLTWDGSTVTQPTVDEEAKTVTVNRASDLAGLAEMVTGGNALEEYTVSLANDYDMGGNTFAGIGTATRSGSTTSSANSFKGTFDGQGHTISNVVINGTDNANDAVGFIANLDGAGTVKDVTFDGLTINAPDNEQAGVVGIVTNGASVSGVTVASGSITAKEAAAGVVGRVLASGSVTSCDNHATINSGTNAGGVVGAAYYTAVDKTITITKCNNYGDVTGTNQAVGGVVGLSAANVSECTNSGNITGSTTATGGIVGQQNCYGNVTGCTNTGTVTGGSGYGSGGIVGWVRYNGTTTNYPVMDVITVTGCTNSGAVSGSTGVGGIVGIWYMAGNCNHNTNTAPSITATGQFVAGIVGGMQWTETGPLGQSVTGDTDMLYVQDNISTTPMSAISGSLSAQYIYVNDQSHATVSDNTDVLEPQD